MCPIKKKKCWIRSVLFPESSTDILAPLIKKLDTYFALFIFLNFAIWSLPSSHFKGLTYCILHRFDENQDLHKETLRNRTRLRDHDNGLASS